MKLNIQMFAKSLSYQRKYRKEKAINKMSAEVQQKPKEEEKPDVKKKTKGEAVIAIDKRAEYEVYILERGKETQVKDKSGNAITRTGAQILDKFDIKDKENKVWKSKAKGNTYRIRKKQ